MPASPPASVGRRACVPFEGDAKEETHDMAEPCSGRACEGFRGRRGRMEPFVRAVHLPEILACPGFRTGRSYRAGTRPPQWAPTQQPRCSQPVQALCTVRRQMIFERCCGVRSPSECIDGIKLLPRHEWPWSAAAQMRDRHAPNCAGSDCRDWRPARRSAMKMVSRPT
jgi:hypothetical protein